MKNNFIKFLATCFGTGSLPAPGSFASFFTLLFFLVFLKDRFFLHVMFTLAVLAVGFLVSGRVAELIGKDDPGEIVIDECAGMLISLMCVPDHLWAPWVSYMFFRICDISKVYPISLIEKYYKGSFGIMADDIGAAIYANIATQIVFRYIL